MNEFSKANATQTAHRPALNRTIEIYQRLEEDLSSFELLKSEEMTLEIICKAVSQRGALLEHVLEPLKTREICLLAVINDFRSLLYVPEPFIDQAFIDFTFAQLDRCCFWYEEETCKQLYQKVPKCLLTQWHYNKLISSYGVFLKWLPNEVIHYDLCFEALDDDGKLLKYVPTHLIDNPMCYQALNSNRDARAFIPEALWDSHCERILAKKEKGLRWLSV